MPGAIPNATWSASQQKVVLIYSAPSGLVQATSADGVHFDGLGVVNVGLTTMLEPVGRAAADVLLRELPDGRWRYFMKGLPPPNGADVTRPMYAADYVAAEDTYQLLRDGGPVYSGGPGEGSIVEVPDIIPTLDGGWRLFYVSLGSPVANVHTAVSSDQGRTWAYERNNPFRDLALSRVQGWHVDPAPFRLSDGRYLAVTMVYGKLYFHTGLEGAEFDRIAECELSTSTFAQQAPQSQIFMDPTLVETGSGELFMYVTTTPGDILVAARIQVD